MGFLPLYTKRAKMALLFYINFVVKERSMILFAPHKVDLLVVPPTDIRSNGSISSLFLFLGLPPDADC